jgi:hypothetical protein
MRPTRDDVTDFEAQPVEEESLRRALIGGAEHNVPEFAGSDPLLAQDAVGTDSSPGEDSGCVVDRCGGGFLHNPVSDLDPDRHPGAGIDGREAGVWPRARDAEPVECRRDATEVVEIVRPHAELYHAPARGRHDPKLFAAVDGGEVVRLTGRRQAEFPVIAGYFGDIWYAHHDACESVQSHDRFPFRKIEGPSTPRHRGAQDADVLDPIDQDVTGL